MNCAECKELLVAYVEGLLADSQKQAVVSHLQGCPPCRAEAAELASLRDRLVANGKVLAQSELENKVLNRIVREQNIRLKTAGKISNNLKLWTMIRKSPVTRLAAAAAIIIIAAVGIYHFTSATPAYGLTEALELYKKANTVHTKGWAFYYKDNGQEARGFPYEDWVDRENGRFRSEDTIPFWLLDPNQPMYNKYYLTVSDGQYTMYITQTTHEVEDFDDGTHQPEGYFVKLSPFQQRLQIHRLAVRWAGGIYGNPEQVEGFAKVGQEQIDGEMFDIWQGEVAAPDSAVPYKKLKIWLSPYSGKIVRSFGWDNRDLLFDGVHWLPAFYSDTVEYDVTPPPDCFKTEPPDGCKLKNTKETTKERTLGEERAGARFYGCIGFTLNDGSVIFAWHANLDPQTSQIQLFENLEPGGPLPKLPAQITALVPWPVKGDITCVGRHLAYTEKAGKFYEWGIYVPNQKMPKRNTFYAYGIIKKYNNVEPASFEYSPTRLRDDLTINSEEDFDTWVRGAMAELSDDGLVPEHVTYDNVLQLAQQIRNSLSE